MVRSGGAHVDERVPVQQRASNSLRCRRRPPIIQAQRGQHPIWVFPYRDKYIATMNNTAWLRARREVGLLRVRIHDLRNTFACRLRTVGVSMEDREALLGYANHSMAGHYASADVGRLLGQANLVLRRKETRTVLRVANAESLWIKGPAEVRQNEKRAHLTLVRSRRREVRVVGPSRSRRSRVAPSPRVLLSRRMSSPTAQDWWPQEFTTSEFGQVRRSATGF